MDGPVRVGFNVEGIVRQAKGTIGFNQLLRGERQGQPIDIFEEVKGCLTSDMN
jgi:hypothetical protein